MIHKPQTILNDALTFTSFNDGDILMTGTPEGVGEINIGDEFVVTLRDGNNGNIILCQSKWLAK